MKQKNKISKIYNDTNSNKVNLENKKKNSLIEKSYLTNYSSPKIIYESDWKNVFFTSDENLATDFYLTKFDSTALFGQNVPVRLSIDTNAIIDVPEKWLPHIQASFLIKDYPNLISDGLIAYNNWKYSTTNYYEIYGDSTLIYKGISPTLIFFPDSDRLTGNISASLLSKWYYGNLEYTIGADNYRLLGYVSTIDTYYDVVPLSGHTGYYSYKRFITPVTDSLSVSSVTGVGTYIVTTAYEDGEGNPQTSSVSTKNVSMSAPIFEDRTDFQLIGYLYKNSLLQGYYNPLTVQFNGDLGGNASLSSFSFDWETRKTWKIFYSNKRAKQFQFSTSLFYITNIPTISDYETAILPYSKITVDVNNTDEYPQKYENTSTIFNPSGIFIGHGKLAENKYKLFIYGLLNFLFPARVESTPYSASFVDEDWNSNGTTYIRVPADRGKELPRYIPNPDLMVNLKIILSLDNAFEYRELKDYE